MELQYRAKPPENVKLFLRGPLLADRLERGMPTILALEFEMEVMNLRPETAALLRKARWIQLPRLEKGSAERLGLGT